MKTPSRILLLGHRGFIGSALEAALKTAPEFSRTEIWGRSLPELDLQDRKSAAELASLIDRDTTVIHLAAIKRQSGDSRESFFANLTMCAHLTEVFEAHPPGRCLFFSSAAVYGEDVENLAINEQTAVQPRSYYGLAKAAGEGMLELALSKIQVPLLVLRPVTVYGEHEAARSYGPAGFLRTALSGAELTLWGDGSELREFVYLPDLVTLVQKLLLTDYNGKLNVASGTSYRFSEIAAWIEERLGTKLKLNRRERSKAKVDQRFDSTLLRTILPGFSFQTLEAGMEKMFTAMRAEHV